MIPQRRLLFSPAPRCVSWQPMNRKLLHKCFLLAVLALIPAALFSEAPEPPAVPPPPPEQAEEKPARNTSPAPEPPEQPAVPAAPPENAGGNPAGQTPPAAEAPPDTPPQPAAPAEPAQRSSIDMDGIAAAAARAAEIADMPDPDWSGHSLRPRYDAPADAGRDALLRGMLSEPDPAMRARALEGVMQNTAPDQRDMLLEALYDPDAAVRETALRGLRAMLADGLPETGLDRFEAFVMNGMLSGDDYRVSCVDAALPVLGEALRGRFTVLLRNEAADTGPRRVAAWTLGRIGHDAAAEILYDLLGSEKEDLAWTCGQALRNLGKTVPPEKWIEVLHTHPAWYMRDLAVDALADGMTDTGWEVLCQTAANAEEEAWLRRRAAGGLARRPGDAGLLALIDLMASSPRIRAYIADLLEARTGREFGSDANAWRGWIEAGRPPNPAESGAPGLPYDMEVLNTGDR
jgi:hypothetical protein